MPRNPRSAGATSRRRAVLALLAAALAVACGARAERRAAVREPVVGLPCEGCELVFVGMPEEIGPRERIAPADEPGEPLRIEGTVRDRRGRPAPGVVVYAYHTDARGVYPPAATRHGRLRGWARTDAAGHYRFDTIRPASYPDRDIPAHVHMHIVEPGCCTYYVDSIHFTDDPLLSSAAEPTAPRGGSGVVTPRRDASGGWVVRRDIVLRENVPGAPAG